MTITRRGIRKTLDWRFIVTVLALVLFAWFLIQEMDRARDADRASLRAREALAGRLSEVEAARLTDAQRLKDLGKEPTPVGEAPAIVERIVGETGASGRDGTNGTDGRDGRDGTNGSDGRDGTDGRDGADGEPGPPGATGPAGPPGPAGPAGPPGADASCAGAYVCEDELTALLAGYATRDWVTALMQGLGCTVQAGGSGPQNMVFTCTIGGV